MKEGLYRQNGNMAEIQSLRFFSLYLTNGTNDSLQYFRFAIEENNLDKLDTASSVHELTGVVKLFFRLIIFILILTEETGVKGAERAAHPLESDPVDL